MTKIKNNIEIDGTISKVGGTPNQLLGADGSVTEKSTDLFREVTYATSVNETYNEQQPNFYIDLTGNITLNVSGITSGSGLVNLNRSSGSEVITLTGETSGNHTYPIGATDVIRLGYSFENGVLVWYCANPIEAGGNVDSVNGNTGVVVLDADDIDDSSTTNKFVTASQLAEIATNTAKTGITAQQASDITANNAKISFDSTSSTKLGTIEANAKDDQTGAEIESLLDAELGGTFWKAVTSSGISTLVKETFTATASQTVFTLNDLPEAVNVKAEGTLLTEGTDYTYEAGVVTLTVGATLDDEVVVDKHYFNTDSVSKADLYSKIETPLIEGSVVADGFWGTDGNLGSNGSYNAFENPIAVEAGDKLLVTGLITGTLSGGVNYGRQIDVDGNVIGSSLANTDYSAALGGWVLTVPSTAGIKGVLLNFIDSSIAGGLEAITVFRGDTIIYESELLIDSNKINPNDKVTAVTDPSFNHNTTWFPDYFYSGTGVPSSSSGNSALRDSIPVSENDSILFSNVTFTTTTNYFRFFDNTDSFLGSKSSNDLEDVAFGKKLIVDIANVAYMKLWLPTSQVTDDVEIIVGDSFLNVNQIKKDSLRNNQALAIANSGYFQRGLSGEPDVPTNVCIEIIGQSQFDGRIPIADYPAYYTSASNTLAGVKICDDGTGVFADYDDSQQKTISSSQRFGVDLYLYKKIHDEVAADCYFIKTTLGGTSLYTTGEGAGRWTPDFDIMEAINPGWVKLTLEQRNAYIAASTGASASSATDVSAIIFMQGESDRIAPEFYYETMLKKIMYDRGVKNNPYIPYILCGVSPDSEQYSYDVELAKTKLAEDFENIYYVAAPTGLANLQGDEIHFNATGGEIFAESIFQQLLAINVI